jgi:S-adenosylmethionine hydrolase
MPRPIITLTTDFGLSDHFVGAMKGVILTIAPNADIVDISHELPPYSVSEACFLVGEATPWFPKKTIHVVVIDPGVGSARRPILVEAAGQYFIGPDNGVFSMVRAAAGKSKVREITNPKWMLPKVSRTFHGRDVFAPSAAHLAKGAAPAEAGKLIADALQLRLAAPEQTNKRAWTGVVLKIDRFGNMITNFIAADFERIRTRPFELAIGFERLSKLAINYAECGYGELFVIEGSSGYLEISANQAHAAKKLGCGVGAPVELTLY